MLNSETYLNGIKLAEWSSILSDLTDIHTKANNFVEKLNDIALASFSPQLPVASYLFATLQ